MSAPRHPVARPRDSWPTLKPLSRRQVGKRLKLAIEGAARVNGAETLDAQADWLDVAKKTLGRWFYPVSGEKVPKNRPSMEQLFKIGQRTGVSVDWLLGFEDIEQLRDARATIGVLSEELWKLMEDRIPPDAFAPVLGERGIPHLASTLIDSFWTCQLRERANETARKFRELTFVIQREGQSIDDPLAQTELQRIVRHCRIIVADLESPYVTWADVCRFRFAYPASQLTVLGALSTPFQVVDGWGFVWRANEYDLAIYIERGVKWGDLGDVKVKRERRPFLVESSHLASTASDVETKPRATPVPPQAKTPKRKSPGRSRK